jgi:hypothetical protein
VARRPLAAADTLAGPGNTVELARLTQFLRPHGQRPPSI